MRKICGLLLIVFLCNSCTRPCQDLLGLESSSLVIYPFDNATNEYLYPEDAFRSPFNRDSLQVFNEDGKRFELVSFALQQDPRGGLKRFYYLSIRPAFIIPDDNSAFNAEKTRKIYLRYNYNTSDTLTLVFKAKRRRCDKSEYEYLKVYHRGKEIASIDHGVFTQFTLKH